MLRSRRVTSVGSACSIRSLCAAANASLPTIGTGLRIAAVTSDSGVPAAMNAR